ncbi:hypothetical protein [Yinghuangia sp. YIM S09857]|uniref:hypothetical protein n=1 Tax=Yinghuangia sp. YIM S09857 TaxID=3436929 RepID=UPI003F5322DC
MRKFSRARVLLMAGVLAAVTATTGAASGSAPAAGAAADSATRSDCRGIGSSFTDKLLPGRCLTNGNYRLEMQYDGNLVLYQGGRACWASDTDGIDGVWAEYSGDWALDSPSMTLESQFGELRHYQGKYTGLHKTGNISLNGKGEVWIAYGKFVSC